MPQTLSIDFEQPIPLFPIPNCVLLPHATIPLHIFEERYRAMTRDALAGPRLIAMASFDGDGFKSDDEGKPALRDHVCVGVIIKDQELPDGRFNLLLQGVCRARIIKEVANDPYRLATLEPSESNLPMEIDLGDQRDRLEKLLADELLQQLASVSAIQNWLSGEIPTMVLVDLAIMTICDDVEKRYAMLAETNIFSRVDWLEDHLRDTRKTLSAANKFGNCVTDDGFGLN